MARVLISGASGLIGSPLVAVFRQRGDEVIALVRRSPRNFHEREWHPEQPVSPELISGFDVVVHLSGESVAGRWTEPKKRRIRESRVITTQNLTRALIATDKKPATFVCASAIGYYGNRGDEVLTEESSAGKGFLTEVCREWEAATEPAQQAGIRVVNLRTGIVLSRSGGAFKKMLLPFRLGLGGRIGSGQQWWSWIHIEDFVRAVLYILQSASGQRLNGPINMTAPHPVTNADFTKTLAHTLHRPAIFPVPGFATRIVFGEFAIEGLLASARVMPDKLLTDGFEFRHSELQEALADLLSAESKG